MVRVFFLCLMVCAVGASANGQVKPQTAVSKKIYRGWEGPDGQIITGPNRVIPQEEARPKYKMYRKAPATPDPQTKPDE